MQEYVFDMVQKDLKSGSAKATFACLMLNRVKCSWRAEHRLTSVQFSVNTMTRVCFVTGKLLCISEGFIGHPCISPIYNS